MSKIAPFEGFLQRSPAHDHYREAQARFLEFVVAAIRNAHMRGACDFLAWCAERRARAGTDPTIHITAWIEELGAMSRHPGSSSGSPRSVIYSTGSSPPKRKGGRGGARGAA
ncbi:hypothetical protein [uncultured Sphingomonas sp.]|uniref:hypothetical protein n=1 Tax=uncultured Sphingomonas sp. TaxID=158754 RepID=UPI00262CBC56|nr:hypothetical protein [uncultured Sphingomonas sp.]